MMCFLRFCYVLVPKAGGKIPLPHAAPTCPAWHTPSTVLPCPNTPRASKTNRGEPETVKVMPVCVQKHTLRCEGRDRKAGGRTAVPTASTVEAERQCREELCGGPQMLPSRHRGFLQGTEGYQQLLSCCKCFCWRWCWEREVDYLRTPRENASQYITDTAPTEKQSECSKKSWKGVKPSPLVTYTKEKHLGCLPGGRGNDI